MNKTILIYLVFIAVSLAGCRNHTDSGFEKWNNLQKNIFHVELKPDSLLLNIESLLTFKDYLLVKGSSLDGEFDLYRRKGADSLEYINSFLKKGRGPYEINDARAFYIHENDMLILIGYNPYGRVVKIPLSDINNLFDINAWSVSDHEKLQSQFNVTPAGSDLLIYQKLEGQDKMFGLYRMSDSTLWDIDIFCPDNIGSVPLSHKTMFVYSGFSFAKRPYSDQFIYSSQEGHYVKTFNINKSGDILTEFNLFDELPQYEVDHGGRITLDESTKSGLRICVSKNYVYYGDPKLTKGNRQNSLRRNGYQPGYVKEIYVSDWAGNSIVKYNLDIPVSCCFVDENDSVMYASSYDEKTLEPKIVIFNL